MKTQISLSIIAVLLFAASGAFAHTQQNPFQAKLLAGQSIEAGNVSVWNDAQNLYVRYQTFGGWALSETHLAVAASLEGIPQTPSGNPKVGLFQYAGMHQPNVTEYNYVIALEKYAGAAQLFIAAHAVVKKTGGKGKAPNEETAWAQGSGFPGKNWAMYFTYGVQKYLKLPRGPVSMEVYWGSNSYLDTTLWNIGEGYNVTNGMYTGWCADQTHYIYIAKEYEAMLYSSYDPNMPEYAKDEDWDMVNYILNHKNPAATPQDVQDAIWFFVGGSSSAYPSDPEALAMVEEALQNGEGFEPAPGGLAAVIIDLGPDTQLTFIEVDP